MSIQPTNMQDLETQRSGGFSAVLKQTRRWEAAAIDERLRAVMITATLLVIPDLILEEQPLRATWHNVALAADWFIWLVFLVEFAAIIVFAEDWRAWLHSYPLAPAMLVLTPPFAPPAIQALRAFRLLRLVRVARGFQLLSKLLTLDGLKYVAALAVFLIIGGGTIFADVQSHAGEHLSTWDGVWWAIGTISTEGTKIEATTDAGRAIAITLMLTGIGVFSILTGAVTQHFLTSQRSNQTADLTPGEQAIMARLNELTARLDGLEIPPADARLPVSSRRRITDKSAD